MVKGVNFKEKGEKKMKKRNSCSQANLCGLIRTVQGKTIIDQKSIDKCAAHIPQHTSRVFCIVIGSYVNIAKGS